MNEGSVTMCQRRHPPVVHVNYGKVQFYGYRSQVVVVHFEVADRPSYGESHNQPIANLAELEVVDTHLRHATRRELGMSLHS